MSAGGMTVRESKAKAVLGAVAGFFKRETVLGVALVLAAVSACFVPPGPGYMSYVDWDTLALLFGLMAVVKGFQGAGAFQFLGSRLLRRTGSTRTMLLVLVFLPFFFSMVITNDVSLITFVPFGLVVLRLAGQERLVIPLVVLQTLAANLGSMLTPMGNPQNLYLYTRYSLGFGELCGAMAPYVALSGLVLLGASLLQKATPIPPVEVPAQLGSPKRLALCCLGFGHFCELLLPYVLASALLLAVSILLLKPAPIAAVDLSAGLGKTRDLLCYGAGFGLCLLGVFKVLPAPVIALIAALFLLFYDRQVLAAIDYSLLGTFVAFFLFVGNISQLTAVQNFLASILEGRVELVSILTSQVISNVPAALLLSGFTSHWQGLIVGCNLGGLGTLIASMASLISYKLVAKEYPGLRGRYFGWFTLGNVVFLALLFGLFLALGGAA